MKYAMMFIGLVDGSRTQHDHRYLKAYDLTIKDHGTIAASIFIESTERLGDAKHFDDLGALAECWKTVSPNVPTRVDGQPNRPLTAFTIEAVRIELKDGQWWPLP